MANLNQSEMALFGVLKLSALKMYLTPPTLSERRFINNMLNLGTLFVPEVPIIVEAREHCAGLAPYTSSDHCSGDRCHGTLRNGLELHCLQSEPREIAAC